MVQLHQRAVDANSTTIPFHQIHELAETKVRHQQRIQRLLAARAEGGFALAELAPQVVDERRKLERVEKELTRLKALNEVRSARWTVVSQLERRVSEWLTQGGIPHGCVIEAIADPPQSELLRKGERILDAVERHRHRLRELAADLHRVKSAPWPSSVAKAAAKAQIEMLAQAGAPNLDGAIEFGQPISFQTTVSTALVHGVDKPATVSTTAIDVLGVLCWAVPDLVISRIEKELDAIADDKNALDEKTRAEKEATIMADALLIERAEVACIWAAEEQNNEIIDFRADTSPQAVLGVALRTVPRASPSPGSSPMHAFDVVMPGRRR